MGWSNYYTGAKYPHRELQLQMKLRQLQTPTSNDENITKISETINYILNLDFIINNSNPYNQKTNFTDVEWERTLNFNELKKDIVHTREQGGEDSLEYRILTAEVYVINKSHQNRKEHLKLIQKTPYLNLSGLNKLLKENTTIAEKPKPLHNQLKNFKEYNIFKEN